LSPWRASSASLVLGLALAAPVLASARFEVAGSVASVEAGLEVTVELKNAGDEKAVPLTVEGELFGRRREARLEAGVDPGGAVRTPLVFDVASATRPGLHALTLLVEWPVGPSPAEGVAAPTASQRAYLLLTVGAEAEPAVTITSPERDLETRDELPVTLASRDGLAHRVRLRVLTPRGLNVEQPEVEVEVPASGAVTRPVALLRAGAPRTSAQGLVLVAETLDGPLSRTSVATGLVRIAGDPAWLPPLRPFLWALCLGLLAWAVLAEVRRPRPAAAPAVAAEGAPESRA
jgi:hypothetical protein